MVVARATTPEEVLAAVTEETGRLLGADHSVTTRYNPDHTRTLVSTWSSTGLPLRQGARQPLGGRNVHTLVFETGQAARIDDYEAASGAPAEDGWAVGLRAAVAVPISIEGRLWGAMGVASAHGPLPADTEERLAGFTELVATAIANAEARMELRGFADEQAALRRVAVLVAQSAAPEEVFAAVAEEAGRLVGADHAMTARYGPDGARTVVAGWSPSGDGMHVGSRTPFGGENVSALVFQAGRAARIDDYAGSSGPVAEEARAVGVHAAVGMPVCVEGRLWGVVIVASEKEPLPADTEARLAGFTELAATAIANAESRAALTESRARIVAAGDAARRRIERDLHDGVQQDLVSLGLRLRAAAAAAPPGEGVPVQVLEGVAAGLTSVLEELREIARGLHPAVLADGGLRPALTALARRSAVPVRMDVQIADRLPEHIEIAAYYVVTEALTNTAKHAQATATEVEVSVNDDVLRVRVRDDGRGGADFARGSGLVGLKDRAEALGGRMSLHSPPGAGTTLEIALPCYRPGRG